MRVLLTGANGFLGRYVLSCLHDQGIETVCLGRQPPALLAKALFIECDLLTELNFPAVMRAARATHLIHLAWYTEHSKYWTSPLNLRWVDATVRLIEAFCQAGGEKVVAAGSCAEYDWSYGYCSEDRTPLNPVTVYGTAKDATRRLATVMCEQHNVPFAWARIFFPFGFGEARQRLIPSLIEVFAGQREPFGVNASVYRDFLHVSDTAHGIVSLLKNRNNGEFNICSAEPVLLSSIVIKLSCILNADPEKILNMSPSHRSDIQFLIGDNSKLKKSGWCKSISIKEGLEKTIEDMNILG